jgi:hypothetical protein
MREAAAADLAKSKEFYVPVAASCQKAKKLGGTVVEGFRSTCRTGPERLACSWIRAATRSESTRGLRCRRPRNRNATRRRHFDGERRVNCGMRRLRAESAMSRSRCFARVSSLFALTTHQIAARL